jgi:putative ABC transport system substrate-binding protein
VKRRTLIADLGAAAVAWPLIGRAQSHKATPVIGFLWNQAPGPWAPFVAAFREGLSEIGYVEGQNLAIEYRWTEDRREREAALAADLLQRHVDVIVTGGAVVRVAMSATNTIPIVFISGDPIGQGLVSSLAHPGGNLTGVSILTVEMMPKRVQLLS